MKKKSGLSFLDLAITSGGWDGTDVSVGASHVGVLVALFSISCFSAMNSMSIDCIESSLHASLQKAMHASVGAAKSCECCYMRRGSIQ